jgi:hypothetical protein
MRPAKRRLPEWAAMEALAATAVDETDTGATDESAEVTE